MKFDKKYLLITSDDFGMTHAVNSGILRGFQKGVIKSSNFMVPCPWFYEAASIAKRYDLPIGVHLTLTCDWEFLKWRPLTHAPSLVDKHGFFFSSYRELMENAKVEEIRQEYQAQIERVLDMGIKPTHVDTHMLTPRIRDRTGNMEVAIAAREVAREYGLRYTYDAKDRELAYFDSMCELSGKDYGEITQHLKTLGAGIHHMVCHCADPNEEQKHVSPPDSPVYRWAAQYREQDLEITTSPRFREFLAENEFELIGVEQWQRLLGDYRL